MANAIYSKFKEALLNKEVDLNSDTLLVALVASEHYTPNTATDDALADIGEVGATSGALQNPTITDGVFNADDITISAVTYAHVIDYVVVYDDTHANKILVAIFDTATGLTITTNGSDIKIIWGASIFNI